MRKKFEIGKVGWHDQNPMIPLVLLDKKTRTALEIKVRDIVRVKHGANESLALVHIQFWELVGTKKITANAKLSKTIDVNVGDKVWVSTSVTDEEKKQFALENHPLRQVFEALSRG